MLGNTRQYLYSSVKLPAAQPWVLQRLEESAARLAGKLDLDSIGSIIKKPRPLRRPT